MRFFNNNESISVFLYLFETFSGCLKIHSKTFRFILVLVQTSRNVVNEHSVMFSYGFYRMSEASLATKNRIIKGSNNAFGKNTTSRPS